MGAEAEFGILIFPITGAKQRRGRRNTGRILRIRVKDLVEMFVQKDRKALKSKYGLSDDDVKKMIIRLRSGHWRVA